MAFRHRRKYDESVPAALRAARASYDVAVNEYEEKMARARREWAAALAVAIEAGMSYQEIADEAAVSHTSISRAIKLYGPDK